MSFTAGPWINGCDSKGEPIIFARPGDSNEEWKANLRLLDAAPSLLEALELIVAWNRDHARDKYGDPDKCETWACVIKAREAIAKALGDQS